MLKESILCEAKEYSNTDFTHQSLFTGVGAYKNTAPRPRAYCGHKGGCTKFDELPQVMSLKSVTARSDDYKCEHLKKNLVV